VTTWNLHVYRSNSAQFSSPIIKLPPATQPWVTTLCLWRITMVTVRKRSKSTSSIVPDENVWLRDKPATSRLAVVKVYLNMNRISTPGWDDLLRRPGRVQSCASNLASNDMPLSQSRQHTTTHTRDRLESKALKKTWKPEDQALGENYSAWTNHPPLRPC
jgi:hypothetical protein